MDAFGEQRRFRYKKRDIELQTHIKIGTAQDQSKTLRLHFALTKSKKIHNWPLWKTPRYSEF